MHKFNPLKLSVTAFLAYTLMATSWPANATWGGYGYGRHAYYGGHYYPSYRYGGHRGYGHRRYSGYYGLSRSLSYGASRDYDSSYDRSANSGVVTGAITSADGWTLLEDGETGQALQVFGAAAAQAPNEGQPKAGYAVAAALSGDYQRGVWAMRRALRIDADALHYLRLKARITGRISGLLPHYGSDYADDGGPFMRGALLYLLGRDADAHSAVAAALGSGDDAVSTHNLKGLIDDAGATPDSG